MLTIQQIIRLRQLGRLVRSIAKEMGLHRRTVTNFWELYKASGVSLEEVLDPEKNTHQLLNIQLDKQIDSE